MAQVNMPLPQVRSLGETKRTDRWWVQPLLVLLGFSAFIVYSTWAAFQGNHFWLEAGGAHYLSPFYSPLIFDPVGVTTGHAWFGQPPGWLLGIWPTAIIPFSPAFLILWAPGGFRFTCYYYRGAYYKAFWGDPVSCAVGEPKFRGKNYRGEHKFPLILQNIHRYFFYLAALFIVLLGYDAVISYIWTTPEGGKTFGVGVGTIVLTLNPIFLGAYTFGCHSFRHLIGGRRDTLSTLGARKKAYDCASCLNRRHMLFAWISLFWVGFTDFYVRMCSMGVISDFRLI